VRELTRIRDGMPEHSAVALEHFVGLNPNWEGAHWDDVLERLLDADANISITDPIYTALRPEMSEAQGRYIVPVTLTLFYANKEAPSAEAVKMWVGVVCGE
jgi:hypothetical protein